MFDNGGYRLETYREYIERIFLQEPELYALYYSPKTGQFRRGWLSK
jgi:hypothetical protein